MRTIAFTSTLAALTAAALTATIAPIATAVPERAPAASNSVVGNSNRAAVINGYRDQLAPLLDVPVGWTGTVDGCKAGTTSKANQTATLKAVNYMRGLAHLPAVTLNATKSKKSQAAALIMAANGYLTHSPPKNAKCWTPAGYDGAHHGNLYLGWGYTDGPSDATGARAVVGYMDDPGPSNNYVGHRRWLLYQSQKTIGTGDTDISNSIYVVGSDTRASARKWVAWPTAGYFPAELEPNGRWSLSYPGADFSKAKITVTTPAGRVPVKRAPVIRGAGDNTLAWDMSLPAPYAPVQPGWDSMNPDTSVVLPDLPVTVKVTGIRVSGATVSKTWTTTLVQAIPPAPPVEAPNPDPTAPPEPDWTLLP